MGLMAQWGSIVTEVSCFSTLQGTVRNTLTNLSLILTIPKVSDTVYPAIYSHCKKFLYLCIVHHEALINR